MAVRRDRRFVAAAAEREDSVVAGGRGLRMSSNVSAHIFGVMIKSFFGQMGDVDQVRDLWKQIAGRGLQPGSFDVRLHGRGPGFQMSSQARLWS